MDMGVIDLLAVILSLLILAAFATVLQWAHRGDNH